MGCGNACQGADPSPPATAPAVVLAASDKCCASVAAWTTFPRCFLAALLAFVDDDLAGTKTTPPLPARPVPLLDQRAKMPTRPGDSSSPHGAILLSSTAPRRHALVVHNALGAGPATRTAVCAASTRPGRTSTPAPTAAPVRARYTVRHRARRHDLRRRRRGHRRPRSIASRPPPRASPPRPAPSAAARRPRIRRRSSERTHDRRTPPLDLDDYVFSRQPRQHASP
jgi:hypothetical protein